MSPRINRHFRGGVGLPNRVQQGGLKSVASPTAQACALRRRVRPTGARRQATGGQGDKRAYAAAVQRGAAASQRDQNRPIRREKVPAATQRWRESPATRREAIGRRNRRNRSIATARGPEWGSAAKRRSFACAPARGPEIESPTTTPQYGTRWTIQLPSCRFTPPTSFHCPQTVRSPPCHLSNPQPSTAHLLTSAGSVTAYRANSPRRSVGPKPNAEFARMADAWERTPINRDNNYINLINTNVIIVVMMTMIAYYRVR